MSESLNMLIHGVQCLALLELACVALELECAALSAESAFGADGVKWIVSVSDSGATTGVSGTERLFVQGMFDLKGSITITFGKEEAVTSTNRAGVTRMLLRKGKEENNEFYVLYDVKLYAREMGDPVRVMYMRAGTSGCSARAGAEA